MKTGQLFWGTFLAALGAIILMVKFDLLYLNWEFVWDMWPLIFVIWGLAVIFKNSKFKPVSAVLSGLLVAVFVYGVFFDITESVSVVEEFDEKGYSREFSKDIDSNITYANLEVDLAVGSFYIRKSTDDLIYGRSLGTVGDYSLETDYSDSTVWIKIDNEDQKIRVLRKPAANKLELKLNDGPVWDMRVNLGAAKTYLDLTPFDISNLVLNAGAANIKVRLGSQSETTYVNVNMGAAVLELLIPKSSGCKITGDMFLVAKDLKGFSRKDNGYYVTENYESADKKVLVDFDSGVSSLKIKRY
jgi:hypothetical protein